MPSLASFWTDSPLANDFGERDERPLDQRDVERRRAFQQLAGLLGQFRVGQRKRREQVPQELVADAVGKLDRVDGHRICLKSLLSQLFLTFLWQSRFR